VTRLLLVRHGQSTWNASGRWQGQADPPLSDLGQLQARHAAGAVGAVDAIYCSTLERAASTADIIAAQIGVGPVIALPALIERDAGRWSGLTRAEIEVEFPGWLAEDRRPPGWETDTSLLERALDALGRIAAAHEPHADVLVVTHGGLIYMVEEHLGAERKRMGNLDGRWVDHIEVGGRGSAERDRRWRLGERLHLLDHAEMTIPDQI